MKKIGIALLCLSLAAVMFCGVAEARRFGGGGSFGGRPGYSRSFRGPLLPGPASGGRMAPSQRRFPMTGLGGFMAGGLLGSLFFGRGMGVWGGGLLDLLLLGFVVWFIVRLMSRRPGLSRRSGAADLRRPPPEGRPADERFSQAERSWRALEGRPGRCSPSAPGVESAAGAGAARPDPADVVAPEAPVIPEGFDVAEFLEGAKGVYVRLQRSWDRRDLKDIALFTTPEVLSEITRQAAADPGPSQTDLVLVKARMLEFREGREETVASVLFDVLLREDPSEDRPGEVREVWHFSRPTGDFEANWRLEGIQQVGE